MENNLQYLLTSLVNLRMIKMNQEVSKQRTEENLVLINTEIELNNSQITRTSKLIAESILSAIQIFNKMSTSITIHGFEFRFTGQVLLIYIKKYKILSKHTKNDSPLTQSIQLTQGKILTELLEKEFNFYRFYVDFSGSEVIDKQKEGKKDE